MDTLTYIAAGVAGILLILTIAGLTMPRRKRIERSIVINHPADNIFPHVASLPKFTAWSPWSEKDPHMKQQFTGEEMEIGASYSWSGNRRVKKGKMITTHIQAPAFVSHNLYFGHHGPSMADFRLHEKDGKTTVAWGLNTDFGFNPMRRVFAPMMERYVGNDFEKGLKRLKAHLEK